jgi:endonuclease G, mitochondrial
MPYNQQFITGYRIPLPVLVSSDDMAGAPLHYHHHSIVMNPNRKFAYFSASNTDGRSWQPIERRGGFIKDAKVDASSQLGKELYSSISGSNGNVNDFDEGHLTSFQEVLWGRKTELRRAGADTFFYTNCVPQHGSLNRGAWRSLEQYLLKKGADTNELKIAVMTGPVLLPDDPYFINQVNGEFVKIPCAFWKVIYYKTKTGLQAVGFMMSHLNLLLQAATVTYIRSDVTGRSPETPEDVFMMFPKATTYQVSINFIENITGMKFYKHGVKLPYTDTGSREIIYKRIEVPIAANDRNMIERSMDEDRTGVVAPEGVLFSQDYELTNLVI